MRLTRASGNNLTRVTNFDFFGAEAGVADAGVAAFGVGTNGGDGFIVAADVAERVFWSRRDGR